MMRKIDWKVKANADWNLWINDDGSVKDSTLTLILLLDIRTELQKMNSILHCPNFTSIPRTLRSIRKNTAKRRKAKPA